MTWRFAVFVLLLSIGPSFATMERVSAGENYAFLVSVKEYDEKELRPLEYSRNDIVEFQQTLVDSGFRAENIVLMHDDVRAVENRKYLPEAGKIRQQLKLLLAGLEDDDSVIVALAGHGVQFKGDSQNYFCPADAKLADRRTLISLQEIYEELKACRASRRLLLVDACRNDPQSNISRSRATVNLESVTRPQKAKVPKGIVALFSCGEGQQSYEHAPIKHGVFFHHVLKGWNGEADGDRDGGVTFDELAAFVKRETTSYARRQLDVVQTPHLQSDYSGEWVLRRVAPVANVDKPVEKPANPPRDTKPGAPVLSGNAPAAGNDLAAAEKELAAHENRLKELFELYAKNAVSKDDIVAQENQIGAAREKVDRLKSAKTPRPSKDRDAIALELAQAQAELAVADLQLRNGEALLKEGKLTKNDLGLINVRRSATQAIIGELQKQLQELEAKGK